MIKFNVCYPVKVKNNSDIVLSFIHSGQGTFMEKIDFKTSGYFPGGVIFTGIVLLPAGLYSLLFNSIAGTVFILISLVILTTHYRLQVDLKNKKYHDYLWILGFKSGEKGHFDSIESIYITKSRVTQKLNHRSLSNVVQKQVYNGYIKFSGNEPVHIITKDSKAKVEEKVRELAEGIKMGVKDYSEE
ncbi:MAG: hypothetical protein OEY34_10665 [Cyclobacteriaceae bacterium]|nr:hypothetical protein [Cyclobacteriaceae bacterium]